VIHKKTWQYICGHNSGRTHLIFSEHERSRSLFAVARPCLSVISLSSVMLVHPTQAVVIFCNLSTVFDMHRKFYGDRPRGSPPSGELNPRGVAKYSDFGPIEGYISETV